MCNDCYMWLLYLTITPSPTVFLPLAADIEVSHPKHLCAYRCSLEKDQLPTAFSSPDRCVELFPLALIGVKEADIGEVDYSSLGCIAAVPFHKIIYSREACLQGRSWVGQTVRSTPFVSDETPRWSRYSMPWLSSSVRSSSRNILGINIFLVILKRNSNQYHTAYQAYMRITWRRCRIMQ